MSPRRQLAITVEEPAGGDLPGGGRVAGGVAAVAASGLAPQRTTRRGEAVRRGTAKGEPEREPEDQGRPALGGAARPVTGDVAGLEAGLDALEAARPLRPSRGTRLTRSLVPPTVAALLLLAVWSALAAAGPRDDQAVPSPAAVGRTLLDLAADGTLAAATWASLSNAVLGFGASIVGGTVLGLLLAHWRPLRTAVGPIVSGLQSLPSITWIPAAVLWFGTTGGALYTVVLFGAIPAIALGLVAGIDRVPPLYRRVGQVLGAGRWLALRYVVLPAALPAYLGGLRQGWAFAWRALMAAELIIAVTGAPRSLGQLLDAGRRSEDMSLVLGVILVILAIGVLVEVAVFSPIERRVLRARGLAVDRP